MSKLTPEARALFDAASRGDGPTDRDRARVRSKLALRLGAGAAVGTAVGSTVGTGSAVAGAKVGVFGGIATKLLAAVIVTGGIGSAGYLATRHDAPARLASATLAARTESVSQGLGRERAQAEEHAASDNGSPAAGAVPEPDSSAEPPRTSGVSSSTLARPTHEASAPAPATASPPTVAPAPSSATPTVTLASGGAGIPAAPARDSLADETALLGEAQAALQQGRGEAAMRALDDHSQRFKSGALRDEERATRVLVLCQLGRVDEARAEAARFLRESPRSPMAARVRGSCAGR